VNDDSLPLWEKAIFGKQVDDFLSSDIGKYLLHRAEKEYFEAILALRDCGPENLLKYQSDMKRAESIRAWLADAIDKGLRAHKLLEEENDE
jgi:hypothetical protein